jgi:hypothetical protein
MDQTVSVLLSSYGQFNLVPKLLPYTDSNIKNDKLRVDKGLINQFMLYGTNIGRNCVLRIEKIPKHIYQSKVFIIHREFDGSEFLGIYETDGDVYMRDF